MNMPLREEDKGSYTYSLRVGVMLYLIIGVRSLLAFTLNPKPLNLLL